MSNLTNDAVRRQARKAELERELALIRAQEASAQEASGQEASAIGAPGALGAPGATAPGASPTPNPRPNFQSFGRGFGAGRGRGDEDTGHASVFSSGRGGRGGRGRGNGGRQGGQEDNTNLGRGRGRGRGALCKWGASCRFGTRCQFSHDLPDLPGMAESLTSGSTVKGNISDERQYNKPVGKARFYAFLTDESTLFETEKDVKKFIVALTSERDQAEVISHLGKQGGRGQERIREICLWPYGFSTQISYAASKRSPLSFQKVPAATFALIIHRQTSNNTESLKEEW